MGGLSRDSGLDLQRHAFRSKSRRAASAASVRTAASKLIELDADTEGNPANGSTGDINATELTNATIQQTVTTTPGETYEISFWYAPRPGDGDPDSSSMEVLWNGEVVKTIVSDSTDEGWVQIKVQVVATGSSSTLGFRRRRPGQRARRAHRRCRAARGQYRHRRRRHEPANRDRDGGRPGRRRLGRQATGKILFDAGADGLKSIAFAGVAGLFGIYVDSGKGTAYQIATDWVPGENAAGGIVGYEKGGTLVGTIDGARG